MNETQKEEKRKQLVKEMVLKLLSEVKRDGMQELMNWLEESDFFDAPASTKYHGSFPGGLAEHSINVYNALVFHYENIKDSEFSLPPIDEESLIIVGVLHDVCKVNTYTQTWKNQKVYNERGSKEDAGGKYDWETLPGYDRKPLLAMGHAAKSVFILQQFIKLRVDEAQAIFWHMGAYDLSLYNSMNELSQAYNENLLAFLLHQADMTCTYITENEIYR